MSKPLELVVHPPAPPKPQPNSNCNLWGWLGDRCDEKRLSDKKRLTDAELAAEYYQSYAEYLAFSHRDPREWAIGDTLHRFATHPHYDEVSTE